MSLAIRYYFDLSQVEDFPLPGFFDGLESAYEILLRAKSALSDLFARAHKAPDLPGVVTQGGVIVGKACRIHPGATLYGPVVIGDGVEIMPGALIRPGSILSNGCSVGFGSELKHAVLLPGSKVASNAFVGDSVLGSKARIGSGVITANRKFDQSEVALKLAGEHYSLGSDYFGLILGDSSRVGANAVTQPGTHIGPHSWVFPLVTARGFIPRETRVMNRTETVFERNSVIELKP